MATLLTRSLRHVFNVFVTQRTCWTFKWNRFILAIMLAVRLARTALATRISFKRRIRLVTLLTRWACEFVVIFQPSVVDTERCAMATTILSWKLWIRIFSAIFFWWCHTLKDRTFEWNLFVCSFMHAILDRLGGCGSRWLGGGSGLAGCSGRAVFLI